MDRDGAEGFAGNAVVRKTLQIRSKSVVSVLDRDPRCKLITLYPDTAESDPEILHKVVKAHNGTAGVYGATIVEGVVRRDDAIRSSK